MLGYYFSGLADQEELLATLTCSTNRMSKKTRQRVYRTVLVAPLFPFTSSRDLPQAD
jgi:hypothetical protein